MLVLGLIVLAASALVVAESLHLDFPAIPVAVLVYAAISAGIVRLLPDHLPNTTFGPANGITLVRGIIVSVLSVFIWHPPQTDAAAWIVCMLACCALILDGIDGAVARRCGVASALGARLDGELDGLLTLVLCAIAFQSGRVGGFVFVAGSLHYVFLLLRYLGWSGGEPLSSNFRRQLIGVSATLLLTACCAPSMGPAIDVALALSAVLILVYSFTRDLFAILITAPNEDHALSDK